MRIFTRRNHGIQKMQQLFFLHRHRRCLQSQRIIEIQTESLGPQSLPFAQCKAIFDECLLVCFDYNQPRRNITYGLFYLRVNLTAVSSAFTVLWRIRRGETHFFSPSVRGGI